nr:unnamed protein product [Digitaria exilis]
MRLAIALLIAALVLAGHVVPPAGGNCNDGLTKSTSTACDSGKLGNADLTGVGDNIKYVWALPSLSSYLPFSADRRDVVAGGKAIHGGFRYPHIMWSKDLVLQRFVPTKNIGGNTLFLDERNLSVSSKEQRNNIQKGTKLV